MALSADEREVLNELDDSGHDDFYAPLLTIALLRFDKLTKGRAHIVATEDVVKLVKGVYDDINMHMELEDGD